MGWAASAAVWVVFSTEIVVLVRRSPDVARWLRGHKLELFVAVTTFPLLPLVAGLDVVARVVPVFELLKMAKVLKLFKVSRVLARTGASGALVRAFVLAVAVVAVGVVGATIAERKVATPFHGVRYLIGRLDRALAGGFQAAAMLGALGLFVVVELWAWAITRRRAAGG